MGLLDDLLAVLPDDGKILEVRIGLHWTSVVAETEGEQRCGLASTVIQSNGHTGGEDVPLAGSLEDYPAKELALMLKAESSIMRSVGMATVNALLPRFPETWVECNADEVIAKHGQGKRVALIGSFPFIGSLRPRVGELIVLEQNPKAGELPANAAEEVLPKSNVVAITGMTLINQTLERLLELCAPQATVLVLGPSTPLHPVLYDHGIHLLSGSIVTEANPVLRTLSQGACFRQIHRKGVRLVTMSRLS